MTELRLELTDKTTIGDLEAFVRIARQNGVTEPVFTMEGPPVLVAEIPAQAANTASGDPSLQRAGSWDPRSRFFTAPRPAPTIQDIVDSTLKSRRITRT